MKRQEEEKKGIEVIPPSIHEQMLKQQDEIYAPKAGVKTSKHQQQSSGLEHVSQAELEQWEAYHTELGCLYVEQTQRYL